jgi:DNA-binding response OmpR family regulator
MQNNKKILVTEDEKSIYRPLVLKLQREGYEVDVAENGEQSISMLKANNYDLLMLDIVMPIMNGFEVLEEMNRLGIKVPVMVLSNLSQNEDRDRVSSLGVKMFTDKSNTPLVDVIATVNKFFTKK